MPVPQTPPERQGSPDAMLNSSGGNKRLQLSPQLYTKAGLKKVYVDDVRSSGTPLSGLEGLNLSSTGVYAVSATWYAERYPRDVVDNRSITDAEGGLKDPLILGDDAIVVGSVEWEEMVQGKHILGGIFQRHVPAEDPTQVHLHPILLCMRMTTPSSSGATLTKEIALSGGVSISSLRETVARAFSLAPQTSFDLFLVSLPGQRTLLQTSGEEGEHPVSGLFKATKGSFVVQVEVDGKEEASTGAAFIAQSASGDILKSEDIAVEAPGSVSDHDTLAPRINPPESLPVTATEASDDNDMTEVNEAEQALLKLEGESSLDGMIGPAPLATLDPPPFETLEPSLAMLHPISVSDLDPPSTEAGMSSVDIDLPSSDVDLPPPYDTGSENEQKMPGSFVKEKAPAPKLFDNAFLDGMEARLGRGPAASQSFGSTLPALSGATHTYPDSSDDSDGEGGALSGSYPRSTRAARPVSPSPHGLVGLNNLGNTCFMNSALQCMSNTRELKDYFLSGTYKREINADNPLGMQGKVAKAFGHLIETLWRGSRGSVAPSEFKYTLAQFAPSFSGYGQQDTQEFLAFFLDGTHEDLNRILKKPYTEAPDWNGGGDADMLKLAQTCWEQYRSRNDSVIVDLFQGQYRSTLHCPACENVSITFDPFMYVTTNLPVRKMWTGVVYVVRRTGEVACGNVSAPSGDAVEKISAENSTGLSRSSPADPTTEDVRMDEISTEDGAEGTSSSPAVSNDSSQSLHSPLSRDSSPPRSASPDKRGKESAPTTSLKTEFTLTLPQNSTVHTVKQAIERLSGETLLAENLIGTELWHNDFYRALPDYEMVTNLAPDDVIVFYEIPHEKQDSPVIHVPVTQVTARPATVSYNAHSGSPFGEPGVLSLDPEDSRDVQSVYGAVLRYYAAFSADPAGFIRAATEILPYLSEDRLAAFLAAEKGENQAQEHLPGGVTILSEGANAPQPVADATAVDSEDSGSKDTSSDSWAQAWDDSSSIAGDRSGVASRAPSDTGNEPKPEAAETMTTDGEGAIVVNTDEEGNVRSASASAAASVSGVDQSETPPKRLFTVLISTGNQPTQEGFLPIGRQRHSPPYVPLEEYALSLRPRPASPESSVEEIILDDVPSATGDATDGAGALGVSSDVVGGSVSVAPAIAHAGALDVAPAVDATPFLPAPSPADSSTMHIDTPFSSGALTLDSASDIDVDSDSSGEEGEVFGPMLEGRSSSVPLPALFPAPQPASALASSDAGLINETTRFRIVFSAEAMSFFPRGETAWDQFSKVRDPALDALSAKKENKKTITLEACLEEFTKEERLGEQDTWYCPKCKTHQQATKKVELWKVPDVLVFALKRFSQSRTLRDKIDDFVDFPVDGFDMSPYVEGSRVAARLGQASDESLIYDLYAVDNHYGSMGGGHYTAYAKNCENGQWYTFDDSRVTPLASSDSVKTAAAYLLFYRRRSSKPLGGKLSEIVAAGPGEESEEASDARLSQAGSSKRFGPGDLIGPETSAPSKISGKHSSRGVHTDTDTDSSFALSSDSDSESDVSLKEAASQSPSSPYIGPAPLSDMEVNPSLPSAESVSRPLPHSLISADTVLDSNSSSIVPGTQGDLGITQAPVAAQSNLVIIDSDME